MPLDPERQILKLARSLTPNDPPAGLEEGELGAELASNPPVLWCGVPTSIAASGRVQLNAPPLDGPFLSLTGGALAGPGNLTVNGTTTLNVARINGLGIQYGGITGATNNNIAFRWIDGQLEYVIDNVAFRRIARGDEYLPLSGGTITAPAGTGDPLRIAAPAGQNARTIYRLPGVADDTGAWLVGAGADGTFSVGQYGVGGRLGIDGSGNVSSVANITAAQNLTATAGNLSVGGTSHLTGMVTTGGQASTGSHLTVNGILTARFAGGTGTLFLGGYTLWHSETDGSFLIGVTGQANNGLMLTPAGNVFTWGNITANNSLLAQTGNLWVAGTGYLGGAVTAASTINAGGGITAAGPLISNTGTGSWIANDFTVYGTLTAWTLGGTLSERQYKRDIKNYERGLDAIVQLNPVSFQYDLSRREGVRYGLNAEDVEGVMPELVNRRLMRLNPEDPQETLVKTVDAAPLTYALINSVQELAARVDALENAGNGCRHE